MESISYEYFNINIFSYQKGDMTGVLSFCHIFIVYILFAYVLYLCENFAENTDCCKYSSAKWYRHAGCNYPKNI